MVNFSMRPNGLLVTAIFAFCFTVSAEYVVYKQNEQKVITPLSQEEFNKVHMVLMRYQFPMNVNPYTLEPQTDATLAQKLAGYKKRFFKFNQAEATSLLVATSQRVGPVTPLTAEETKQVSENEEEFLRKKIKDLDSDFKLAFVPTTLYELKSLEVFGHLPIEELYALENKIIKDLQPLTGLTVFASLNGDLPLLWQAYILQNYLPGIVDAAYRVNTAILSTWFQSGEMKLHNITGLTKSLLDSLYDSSEMGRFLQLVREMGKIEVADFDSEILEVFNKAVALEYEAHANNKAIVWRGTKAYAQPLFRKSFITKKQILAGEDEEERQLFIDSTVSQRLDRTALRNSDQAPVITSLYSNSYGNSLFAGRRDEGKAGAMALQYMIGKAFIGYGLLIDKAGYIQHSDPLSRLFFISPLSTMVGLFARGELFHSRSRVALCSKAVPQLSGFPSGWTTEFLPETTTDNIIAFNAFPLTPADHENEFSRYLVQNARIIRNDSRKRDSTGKEINAPIDEATLRQNQLRSAEEKYPTETGLLQCK